MDQEKDSNPGMNESWAHEEHQIFILSSAGKPIFVLHGDEQMLSSITGLIQGTISFTSSLDNEPQELNTRTHATNSNSKSKPKSKSKSKSAFCGDVTNSGTVVRYIYASSTLFIFHIREGITFLALTSPAEDGPEWMEIILQFLFQQILFILTEKGLNVLQTNPSYDLRELLGGTEKVFRGLLSTAFSSVDLWLSACQCLAMESSKRALMGRILRDAFVPNAMYSILTSRKKLVSFVQPKNPAHVLQIKDLLLLMNFINYSPALCQSESWTPVCFPHFNQSGFLYAYVVYLHKDICLVMISANQSSDQFHSFQAAKATIEQRLQAEGLMDVLIAANDHATKQCDTQLNTTGVSRVGSNPPTGFGTFLRLALEVNHCIVKHEKSSQYVASSYGRRYRTRQSREKLLRKYHRVYSQFEKVARMSHDRKGTNRSKMSYSNSLFMVPSVNDSALIETSSRLLSNRMTAHPHSQKLLAMSVSPSVHSLLLTARVTYRRTENELIFMSFQAGHSVVMMCMDPTTEISVASEIVAGILEQICQQEDQFFMLQPFTWNGR